MSPKPHPDQIALLEQFDSSEMTEHAFTKAALELGISQARINGAIGERRQAERIAAEEAREARAANGQFGAGA